MKPDQLYHNLKEVADKLGIAVREQNFRNAGIHVSSGLCRIKEEQVFIMDKRLTIREKTANLAECLATMNVDDIYIVPAIRSLLDRYKDVAPDSSKDGSKDDAKGGSPNDSPDDSKDGPKPSESKPDDLTPDGSESEGSKTDD